MKIMKRLLSCLLAVFLLLPALPAALAAGDDMVLTSIGHSAATVYSFTDSSRSATLYVPHSYSGTTLDLTNGLKITYDESLYKSVVAQASGAAVICDADDTSHVVQVKVWYNYTTDGENAVKNQTTYSVRVVRAEARDSVFSGMITRTVKSGNTLSFTASDLEEDYQKNDGPGIDHFVVRGSNLVAGMLTYSAGDVFSTPISLNASGSLTGSLTFQAAADGTVSYYIDAYEKNASDPLGTAVLTITVDSVPGVKSVFAGSAYVGVPLTFTQSDFASRCNLWGGSLQTVEITPADSACGTWYLGSDALSVGTAREIDVSQLGNLSFTGSSAGTVPFSWRVSTASGYSDAGSGTITVFPLSLTLSSYTASSRLARGGAWTFSASQFAYTPASAPVTYLKIKTIPASADGYLCLTNALAANTTAGYPALAANTALKAGAILPYNQIPYLKLVAASSGNGSSISFTWTATADSKASSATWASDATYAINFVSGGTVSYSANMNIPLALDKSDFSSVFSSQSGYTLSYVTFTQTSQTGGKLYSDYSLSTKTGTAASSSAKYYVNSSPNLSGLTFVPTTNFVGTVDFAYKAYRSDGTYLSGTLEITVSNSGGGTVSYTMDKNGSLALDAADFSAAFQNATGETLSSVRFSIPSSYNGSLYYNYSSSTSYDSMVYSSTRYYVHAAPYLSYVTFVPYADYTGTVSVGFTGYTSGGAAYTGKLYIFVVDSPAGIVSYTSRVNGSVALLSDDFSSEFIRVTGSVLSYVTFTPPDSAAGMLYDHYDPATAKGTAVSGSTKYYNGFTPDISDLTFVPAADFVGNVEIKYTVYTAAGVAYAGKLKIRVGEASAGTVSYSTDLNTSFSFRASDFAGKFYSNTGGSTLSYVTFTLPSSTYGTLYYNYVSSLSYGTSVVGGKAYGVSTTPYLSNITFVPRTGYYGSFSFSYTGYTSDGTGYAGKVSITVGSAAGAVSYETDALSPVTFSTSDFQKAFQQENGGTLYSVKFSLPSASAGTLYYGYTSASSYTSEVSSGTRYYVGSSPYLSRVTFVPNPAFSGTFSIAYTAYNSSGSSGSGVVVLTVNTSSGGIVDYTTDKNTTVKLDGDDFNDVFQDETGSVLYSVKFTLPSASCGTLYYNYTSSGTGSKVSASTSYFRSFYPQLSAVTFVPANDYVGVVNIPYLCYTSANKAYSGQLRITVLETDPMPFSDVRGGYSWAAPSVATLYKKGVILGYQSGLFHPGNNLSRGDFILMVVRAFGLTDTTADNFYDVPAGSYYYAAIAAAKADGIVLGNNGYFYPDTELSRQDAAVILARALSATGTPLGSASASDLSGFSDAARVSDYAVSGLAALVRAGILQGNNGVLNPRAMITRAEMAVILSRAVAVAG